MKAYIKALSVFLFAATFIQAQNAGDSVFAGIQVHTIKLYFNQTNYWDSLTYYYGLGTEQLMEASATIDSVSFPSVGVRLKGNSSYSHPNNKKPFKIDFDEYISDQRWNGLKGVHLNNCWNDPTFMREKTDLDFCQQAGIAAPRANYAALYLNDSLWGLYSLVEPVDKIFLKTHYGNKNGDMFKAVDAFTAGGNTNTVISDFRYYGATESSYSTRYDLKTDGSTTAWPSLVSFLTALNNNSSVDTVLTGRVNLNAFYKALSNDIIFSSLDSYAGSGRNFYFYFMPGSGKIEWIVWDVGMSYGNYSTGQTAMTSLSPVYVSSATERPLVNKIYSVPALKQAYLKTFDTLFTNYFTTARLFQHIDSIANVIRPYVSADTKKMFTLQQFETNITNDITVSSGGGTGGGPGGGNNTTLGLKSFITSRISNLKTQLAQLITGVTDNGGNTLPSSFSLAQNYPNPFNPETVINYSISKSGFVTLRVYDALGKEVTTLVNEYKAAGSYNSVFSSAKLNLSSGIYYYKLIANGFMQVKKMILLK